MCLHSRQSHSSIIRACTSREIVPLSPVIMSWLLRKPVSLVPKICILLRCVRADQVDGSVPAQYEGHCNDMVINYLLMPHYNEFSHLCALYKGSDLYCLTADEINKTQSIL